MSLRDLIHKSSSIGPVATATLATPATVQENGVQGVATVAGVAVAKVFDSIMLKIPALSLEEKALLHAWLANIGESNAEAIARVIRRCQEDISVREYFLKMAEVHKKANRDITDDRHYCHQCVNLTISGYCLAAQQGKIKASRDYKPIGDLPFRCEGFKAK